MALFVYHLLTLRPRLRCTTRERPYLDERGELRDARLEMGVAYLDLSYQIVDIIED